MSELKPCPFCGGEAELHQSYDMDTNEVDGWFVWCNNKECECAPETREHFTEAEAIVAWNTRAERIYATGGIIAQAECRDVCASISEFTCSSCGFNCDLTSWISLFDGDSGRHRHHHFGTPNYCPNCGAKVVGE